MKRVDSEIMNLKMKHAHLMMDMLILKEEYRKLKHGTKTLQELWEREENTKRGGGLR